MKIVIIATEAYKKEFLIPAEANDNVFFTADLADAAKMQPTVVIDLLFDATAERIKSLVALSPATIVVNDLIHTLPDLHPSFIRINGWPGFMRSAIIEGCSINEEQKNKAEVAFGILGKKIQWLADTPGLVSARIIANIINEAFMAWGEGVSSQEDIDTAMKLGTNYPHGPFEWAEIIGREKVRALLLEMSKESEAYLPCEALGGDHGS